MRITRAEIAAVLAVAGIVSACLTVDAKSAKRVVRRKPGAAVTATTLSVGDQVVINGVTYVVAATLVPVSGTPGPTPTPTPTPAPTPTPIPTPTPTPAPTGFIDGYRNTRRDWVLAATEGDLIFIDGGGFGGVPGSVILDQTIKAPVLSWGNQEIAITLPHVAGIAHVPAVAILSPAGSLLAAQNNGALTINPRLLPAAKRR